MRLRSFGFSFALVLSGFVPCIAQQLTSPQALESSLEKDAAAGVDDAAQKSEKTAGRPKGTLVRPNGGVQHPNLDKAWADYDEAVGKFADDVGTAIKKQVDTAADKGDLEAVKKWEAIQGNFEKKGALPDAKQLMAVTGVVAKHEKAKTKLLNTYSDVYRKITRNGDGLTAKKVKDEYDAIEVKSILCAHQWLHRNTYCYVFAPDGTYILEGKQRSGTYEIVPNQKAVILHWNNEGGFTETISVGDTPNKWTMEGGTFMPRP